MQVMDGGDKDLHDILEEMGGLPENQCRYVFDSMATAVQQMHMMDLVHHDLKPKNFVRCVDHCNSATRRHAGIITQKVMTHEHAGQGPEH